MYGLNALKIEMNETVTVVSEEIHKRDQSILRVGGLRHDITDQARIFRQMAADDRKYGKYTGFPDSGAFTLAADQIALSLENLDKQIQKTMADNAEKIASANNMTEAMRETVLRVELPFQIRLSRLDTDIQAVNKLLNGVSVATLTGTIDRSLKRHTRMVVNMRPTSKRSDVAAGQERAIAALQSQMHSTSKTLQTVLQELTELDKTEPIQAKPAHIMKATLLHWDQFAPQFIGALAFDLSPFLIVILLFIKVRMVQDQNGHSGRNEVDVSIGQAVQILQQLEKLKQIQNNPSNAEPPRLSPPASKSKKPASKEEEGKPWLGDKNDGG